MKGSAFASMFAVGDGDDALRRADRIRAERGGDRLHRCLGEIAAQAQAAGERRVLREIAAEEIGVGDGRARAALPVAGRPRRGAGRARADFQHGSVEPGDRAAAGADRLDGGDGHHQREIADAPVMRHHRALAADQRDVRAGAAHVHGQQIGLVEHRAERGGGGDAGGGAGEQRVDRHARRLARTHHAAIRLGDEQPRFWQLGAEEIVELREIAGHGAACIGVEQGRGGALVFLRLRPDLVREDEIEIGERRADRLRRRDLMGGIAVGVQEADRDGCGTRRDRSARGLHGLLGAERRVHAAIGEQPLLDLEHHAARDEWGRAVAEEIDGPVHPQSRDVEDVLEPGGDEQRERRAAALDHRVRADRGAVHDERVVLRCEAALRKHLAQARFHAFREIGRRRRHLEGLDRGVAGRVAVPDREIREGAADVDADAKHARRIGCAEREVNRAGGRASPACG